MFHPVFIVLVVLAAVLLWFLLAFLYKLIGKLFYRIWQNCMDEIRENDGGDKNE